MSATPDSTLDDPQQTIADLQRQLAESNAERDEYKTERDEALDREAATAEVLQVINSFPGDLAPVFDAILQKAHALCGAAHGVLVTRAGEEFHFAAAHGEPSFVEAVQQLGPHPALPYEGSFLARLLRGERVIHLADTRTDDSYRKAPPQVQRLYEVGGSRTLLAVPLRKDDAVLGFITAFRQEIRPFSDKQIALLQNFAAQAVIAMDNARLITETREALEQQTATSEVLGVINSSPGDLAPVFDAILDKAHSLCAVARGSLELFDGENFRAVATRGLGPADELRHGYPASRNPATRPLIEGEPFTHIVDMSQHEFPFSRRRRAGTLLCVPLRRDDNLLGMIASHRLEVQPFNDQQIALLQNFAAQAVIAIENARLITETREALEQQTATAEVLGVINSSPGDLTPVFEAMLEKAMTLCGVAYGSLQIYDGLQFRAVAVRGLPEPIADQLRRGFRLGPKNPMRPLLDGDPFVHILDLAKVDDPQVGVAVEHGSRTLLCIPLRKDGSLIGQIVAVRQEVRPFTDKQIALLQNFAAQAVIAMENARLITETHEALEQQTATAEVLQVINSSPGNLAPVFDAILEKAHALCGAPLGSLVLCDGEQLRAVATRGYPQEYDAIARRGFSPTPPFRWLLSGEPFVQVADFATPPAPDEEDHPTRRAAVEIAGVHTALFVPLRKDKALLGYISAQRQEVRPFSEKQIALLQNFAAQAVIAMENARLITETREALEQQTATAEVLGVINSSPGDLAPVFDAILEKAHSLCGAANGTLVTYDGEHAWAVATQGVSEPMAELLRQPFRPLLTNSPHARVVRQKRVIQIPDLSADTLWEQDDPKRVGATRSGVRTMLFVPLRKDDLVLGWITTIRREVRPFSDKEIALLESFAAQAVIAMENARLITETREALEQQTATAEILGVINSSPGDLAPVFHAMLEKAVRLCGAEFGVMNTFDGEHFHHAADQGVPAAYATFRRDRGPTVYGSGTTPARLVAGESLVHTIDLMATEPYEQGDPARRALVDLGGARSHLCVALRKGDILLGDISIYRQDVHPFIEKQIVLLQNFAAQAVIAMENARLLGELRQRTDEVGELNRGLEARVAEQVDELGRVGRLKRFLAPQLAELIVSQGDEKILESHRREIVVVFCDLRGYTAFTETAEPEEVLDFLREYHGALGPLVSQFEGTLDQFSGDGIMVFFNDPIPCPDPAERAVKMAVAMREEAGKLIATWRRDGCELGFGVGIAQGYATLGQIGFSERSGYTAIGTVCNLAARLCAEAKDGQILISSRVARAVEAVARLEDLGNLELRGLRRPVAAFNVVQSPSSAEARPNLTVVAKGPGV